MEASLVCPICLESSSRLHSNAGCKHAACDACWKSWVEQRVPLCVSTPSFRADCFGLRCQQPIADDIWQRACIASEVATDFAKEADSEVARMRRGAGNQFILAVPPFGLVCPICLENRPALLANPSCDHAACEDCWGSWAEAQLPLCRERRKLRPRCFGHGCRQEMFGGMWRHICSRQQSVREFSNVVSTELSGLKQAMGKHLIFPHAASSGLVCPLCDEYCVALLVNGDCEQTACEKCWKGWIEACLPDCVEKQIIRPRCCCVSCRKPIANNLWNHVRACSVAAQEFSKEVDSTIGRLKRTANKVLVWAPLPTAAGPVCPVCLEHRIALLKNPGCEHTACEDCWRAWAEARLPQCIEKQTARPHCCGIGCQHPMAEVIWNHVRASSELASGFGKLVDAEIDRLQRSAGTQAVVPALSPSGLQCQICQENCRALLRNSDCCSHAACENCWEAWVKIKLPSLTLRQILQPPCFGFDCWQAVDPGIWRHTRMRSTEVDAFACGVDLTVKRLESTAGQILVWAPLPTEPGPVCPICSDHCPALLANPKCNHVACENCWRMWVEMQLPHCRGRRQASVRCIGAECQEEAVSIIWRHTCTQSDSVRSLDGILSRRRHLQANVLYPAEVQVECPRAECLGLAYRGFDTLMCFFCEHQWPSDTDDAPPVMVGEDLIAGLQIKQCPSCGAHIIKNGGCDHMTCRCKHQFWWSTLGPYPR
mmetsp:Transcript_17006/g.30850  ORF Transcript_17006/g.30850 Transcript_17006/m.30850 type:complete len:711 (+) Transcript_17006:94-2226(+)